MAITGAALFMLAAARTVAAGCTMKTSRCEHLANIYSAEQGVTVLNSTIVASNALNISNHINEHEFCRVFAEVKYPQDNTVVFEVWMPGEDNYNGRYLSIGDGGLAGVIDELGLMLNLNQGYAVAGGDSGHRASENNGGVGGFGVTLPFLNDRNQILAWIRNSVAFFTPPAKAMVEAYYNRKPHWTYYKGCSTGGAQGFALAQFYPHLFDGIVAGSPGNWYSHLILSFLWNAEYTAGNGNISQELLNIITTAALKDCDSNDGVTDGVIENPQKCNFDITSLSCNASGANQSACLTPSQVNAAKAIYKGPYNRQTGDSVYPGFTFGSEAEWQVQEGDLADAYTISLLQNAVFDDLGYNQSSFNWGSDINVVDEKLGSLIDSVSLDLSEFAHRGGKLIVTQGWSDPYNAATYPMEHRELIQQTVGGDVSDWFQLFMVPGGGHCGSASFYPQVPGNWHSLDKMVSWVEDGSKPTEMLADTPADGSNATKKLCAWPKVAKLVGDDPKDWASFSCVEQEAT